MNLPAMLRAPGQGITIQLAHWQGPGPNVLAVHGLTANCRSFDTIAQETAPPLNLYAVDLRGRGLSDHPGTGYSLEHHSADLAQVIAYLGLERMVVMGHSLGAFIALALAARHPELVAGLILLDGGAVLTPEQWTRVGAGVASSVERLGKRFDSRASYLEAIRKASPAGWNSALEEYYLYDCREYDDGYGSRIDPGHIAEERSNLSQTDLAALHARVTCPVLVLRALRPMLGGDEMVLPDQALPAFRRALPSASLVELPELDHFGMVFQPSLQRTQAIKAFLGI